MKKKFLPILIIAIMVMSFFGCSSNTPEVSFDAVREAFLEADFIVLGPSTPHRQTALHAYTNCGCVDMPRCGCGDEIWIFLHETRSAANTAWDAGVFFSNGRNFENDNNMTVHREGRLVFYGTPIALEIFAEARNG